MQKIFLSYHFDPVARELAAFVENLIHSHGIAAITGRNLAGQSLTPAIKTKIQSCDALIYIRTKRRPDQSNDWVMHEVSTAEVSGLPFIGIIQEELLPITGPFMNKEYIPFSDIHSAELWLKISTTIGLWKAETGSIVEAMIEPPQLATMIRQMGSRISIEYCLYDREYNKTDWKPARFATTPAGVSVLLPGVRDKFGIQIRVRGHSEDWVSDVNYQKLRIELRSNHA